MRTPKISSGLLKDTIGLESAQLPFTAKHASVNPMNVDPPSPKKMTAGLVPR